MHRKCSCVPMLFFLSFNVVSSDYYVGLYYQWCQARTVKVLVKGGIRRAMRWPSTAFKL